MMPGTPQPPCTVLLAEDNSVNQLLATRFVEKRGPRVTVAANGREAVAALDIERDVLVPGSI
jgi:CheY-like chemotaxis protein